MLTTEKSHLLFLGTRRRVAVFVNPDSSLIVFFRSA